ncbi:MAG: hypothetical protein ACKVPY_03090 [Paracoccaceae bacterium]
MATRWAGGWLAVLAAAVSLAVPDDAVARAGKPGNACAAAYSAAKRAKQIPRGQSQDRFMASCAVGMVNLSPAARTPAAVAVPTLPVAAAPGARVPANGAGTLPITYFPPTSSLLPAVPAIGAPAAPVRRQRPAVTMIGVPSAALIPPISAFMPGVPGTGLPRGLSGPRKKANGVRVTPVNVPRRNACLNTTAALCLRYGRAPGG